MTAAAWPDLPFDPWQDTCATLHLWTQIVGKIRLGLTPMANHWWQVPLYVTCRGLTTSPIPYDGGAFQLDFDFIDHLLVVQLSDGRRDPIPLHARSVAEFYAETMDHLAALGIKVRIWTMPVEITDAIPFEADHVHKSYDAVSAHKFWRILLSAAGVLKTFQAGFMGKASPVHFFWGSFDLATSRFSGRRAPPHPGGVPGMGDWVVREAYSHELWSCGFWPGNGGFGQAAFYSYAYPEPPGFAATKIGPAGASYNRALGEFVLPYDAVRLAASPEAELLGFLHNCYAAAADLGQWDRSALERV